MNIGGASLTQECCDAKGATGDASRERAESPSSEPEAEKPGRQSQSGLPMACSSPAKSLHELYTALVGKMSLYTPVNMTVTYPHARRTMLY